MIVFSGTGASDVWVLSFAGSETWSQLTPSGTPLSARSGHTAIYDWMRDRMIVFGGNDGADRNDVWELTLSGTPTWTLLSPAGAPPGPRSEHTAIYDWIRDRMIVYGGFSVASPLGDVWALSLAGTPTWTQLAPTGGPPSARGKHAAIYDEGRDRMVVFSGNRGSLIYTADVWALSLAGAPIWTQLAPSGQSPIGRDQHTAVYDAAYERLVVFGGFRENSVDDPNTLYDAAALEWNALVAAPAPVSVEAMFSARVAPNPATGPLTIDYTLPRGGSLAIRIYDLSGRVVRTLARGAFAAGSHAAQWDRRDEHGLSVRAGVYFAALEMDRTRW